jgi:hypothetical protein
VTDLVVETVMSERFFMGILAATTLYPQPRAAVLCCSLTVQT